MRKDKQDPETTPQDSSAAEPLALAAVLEEEQEPEEMREKGNAPVSARAEAPRQGPSASSGFRQNLWRAFLFVIKFGLFLAVLAGFAAGVYFGWPILYNQYVLPVQNNTAQMALLEKSQQANQEQLAALQTQLPAQLSAQLQQADALSQQALALTALAPRMDGLTTAIDNHTLDLATLIAGQTDLQAVDRARAAELENQVKLLKSMELLSRARLFLYQSNFGLAKQDVQTARDLLASLLGAPGFSTGINLVEVVQRLDLTLSRLPDFPVAASDDLDIAWQILLEGQPLASATPGALPIIVVTPDPNALPMIATETPLPFPTPTFVPTATP